MITLNIVNVLLAEGGFIRYTWGTTGHAKLVKPNGDTHRIDGRTYQAVLRRKDLVRTETGSTDADDLVIEWRLAH